MRERVHPVCLACEIYCSEITRVRQRPLLTLSLFLSFLIFLKTDAPQFPLSVISHQLYTELACVSYFCCFLSVQHFFFSLVTFSLGEWRAEDKSPFDCYVSRITNFKLYLYYARFFG